MICRVTEFFYSFDFPKVINYHIGLFLQFR